MEIVINNGSSKHLENLIYFDFVERMNIADTMWIGDYGMSADDHMTNSKNYG